MLVAFLLAYSAKSVGKTYNMLVEGRVVGAADHRLAIRRRLASHFSLKYAFDWTCWNR